MSSRYEYGGIIEGINLKLTPELSELQRSHTRFVSNLSAWKQYIIWRYTIGSGQLNKTLIGISEDARTIAWAKHFYSFYNKDVYGLDNVEPPFTDYIGYFKDPSQVTLQVAQETIATFMVTLIEIIQHAPITQAAVLVYKVSTVYAPEMNHFLTSNVGHADIIQKPFNSTTYDPEFEFGTFLAEEGDTVVWQLLIPAGTHCLFINPIYHAYPHEREVLLPPDIVFSVRGARNVVLEYINKGDIKPEIVQKEPYVIGEVFRQTMQPPVKSKTMRMLTAVIKESPRQ